MRFPSASRPARPASRASRPHPCPCGGVRLSQLRPDHDRAAGRAVHRSRARAADPAAGRAHARHEAIAATSGAIISWPRSPPPSPRTWPTPVARRAVDADLGGRSSSAARCAWRCAQPGLDQPAAAARPRRAVPGPRDHAGLITGRRCGARRTTRRRVRLARARGAGGDGGQPARHGRTGRHQYPRRLCPRRSAALIRRRAAGLRAGVASPPLRATSS